MTSNHRVQDATHLPVVHLHRDLGRGRVLRLARPEEFEAVGTLLQQAFTDGCWVTPLYLAHLADVASRAATSHIWVVADARGPLAAVLTPKPQHHAPTDFTFNVLGVGTRGRGLGLGRTLVAHAVELARSLGYRRVDIRSSPQMTAAHDLYYSYGFVRRPEQETAVVDSGQRLYAFSYRIPDPLPVRRIPYEPPPTPWAFANRYQETPMSIEHLRPPSATEPAPAASGNRGNRDWRLRVDRASLRGRAAAAVLQISGLGERIEWTTDAASSPAIIQGDGGELPTDWRRLSRDLATWGALFPDHYREQIETLANRVVEDLIETVESALFADDVEARTADLRLFYARLGWFDNRIGPAQYLVGDRLTVADLELVSVLVSLDFQYRAHLPRGSAAVADYPNLFRYASDLLASDALPTQALRGTGVTAADELAWGEPAPVEGIDDLRAAWLGREAAA